MPTLTRPRFIVVAGTVSSGRMESENVGIDVVAIVTPRTPNAALGLTADRIFEATSLSLEDRERLLPLVIPALASSSPLRK